MMLRFLPSKAEPGKKPPEETPRSDFIPYTSHFDPKTLLTKNGELLQVIRLSHNTFGLPQEFTGSEGAYLRDAIREAIGREVNSNRFAFWIHTLRTKQPLDIITEFPSEFAQRLNDIWAQQQKWKYAFENEVYITVLREGQLARIWDKEDIKKGYSSVRNRQYRDEYLETAAKELHTLVSNIASHLARHFNPVVLSVREEKEDNGQSRFYSEPGEFMARLVNLRIMRIPLDMHDMSQQIAEGEMTFGFNAMENRMRPAKRRFAAILSLKHFSDLPPQKLDVFLQLPIEMTVCQSFDFIPAEEVLSEFKEEMDIAEASQDAYIAEVTGLNELKRSKRGNPTDFARQQTSITVAVDDYAELDDAIHRVQRAVASLGLVAVREDIRLEEFFWSYLPGNFEFLRRQQLLPAHRTAGMVRLNFYPLGELTSEWGKPVAVFPTTVHTPYLFHYHHHGNGHTLLLDYNSFPDNAGRRLLHFLLTQSTGLQPNIIFFDQGTRAALLARELGGKYLRLGNESGDIAVNPLAMEDTRRNRGFILAWLGTLIGIAPEDETAKAELRSAIDKVFEGQNRNVQAVAEQLNADGSTLAKQLLAALELNHIQRFLRSDADELAWNTGFTVLDLGPIMDSEAAKIALFSYLLHRVIIALDGRPTIIVLNEAWELLDNHFFAPRLESLLEMLKENNALMVMRSDAIEKMAQSAISGDIMRLTPTKLFVPDDVPVNYYPELTGLTQEEERMLLKMERQKGQFLIKHGDEVIPSYLKITDERLVAVLNGERNAVHATQKK